MHRQEQTEEIVVIYKALWISENSDPGIKTSIPHKQYYTEYWLCSNKKCQETCLSLHVKYQTKDEIAFLIN